MKTSKIKLTALILFILAALTSVISLFIIHNGKALTTQATSLGAISDSADFVIEGTACNGLSDSGKEKLNAGYTEVVIPDTVESIGISAFNASKYANYNKITAVTMQSGVTRIRDYAFGYCTGLNGTLTIPSSVNSITLSAFEGLTGCTSIEVAEGNTVFSSSDGILYKIYSSGNRELFVCPDGKKGTVEIPSNVTAIGYSAFEDCSGLTSVTIPSSVTSIGMSAFLSCIGLTSITIPSGITKIDSQTFKYCAGLTNVTIPSSVTTIGSNAFCKCTGLTNVALPDSLKTIGDYAFEYCSGLTGITIPEGVTSIGIQAFMGCTGLTNVTIPSSVTSVGNNAFRECSKITDLTICEGVTSIGGSVFMGCTGLTNVTIPSSITSMGTGVFNGCSGLTSVTICEGVKSIGDYAFINCTGLTGTLTIPSSVTSLGGGITNGTSLTLEIAEGNQNFKSEGGVIYDSAMETLLSAATTVTSVTVPSSVTTINSNAFAGCNKLTSITIPEGVTSINESTFYECTGLISVTLPSSVTSIGRNAFSGCNGLTDVTVGSGVTSIGNYVFINCSNLKSINVDQANGTYSSNNGILFNKAGTSIITVPEGKEGELIIPDGVISILDDAFYHCKKLTRVTIPSSVTSIGNSAFSGCSELITVTIGSGANSISNYTFASCSNLKSIYVQSTALTTTHINNLAYNNQAFIIAPNYDNWNSLKDSLSTTTYNIYPLSAKDRFTYETQVTFKLADTSHNVTQTKLGNRALNYVKQPDGTWAVDENYKLPTFDGVTVTAWENGITATSALTKTGDSVTYTVASIAAPVIAGVNATYNQNYAVSPEGFNSNYMRVTYTGIDGTSYAESETKPTYAGTYTITVKPRTGMTFTLSGGNPTATLTIDKANYQISGYNNITVDYDGAEHRLGGSLPTGVTATITYNGEEVADFAAFTNAGTYVYTVAFDGDYTNYNEIADRTITLTINKATYDLSGITFENATFDLDNEVHGIAITGTLPDGVTVEYVYKKNGMVISPTDVVTAGEYTVTAVFTIPDEDNYNTIADKTVFLTIKAPADTKGEGLSTAAIIAIVVVAVLVVAIAIVAVVIATSRNKVLVQVAGSSEDSGFDDEYYEE